MPKFLDGSSWASNALRNSKFFLLLWFTYAYFYQGSDPNQLTRIFLTEGLVDRGAVDILPYHAFTIDKSELGGSFYCDKAPGLSFLAIPFYLLQKLANRLFHFSPDDLSIRRAQLHLLVIFLCGLSGAVAAFCLSRVLRSWSATVRQERVLVTGYALGTLAFPFSTALFAHQLVAALLIGTLALMTEVKRPKPLSAARLTGIGALWGLSIISEYPSALLIAVLGLYLLSLESTWRARARAFAFVAAGALGPLVVHSVYLKVAFGSPFELPYKHVFEPMFRVHHDEGLLGINPPTPAGIFGVLISRYRGIFFLCPFLLLYFFGIARWVRSGIRRSELLLIVGMTGAYLLFNSSYYAWDGGGSTGPRHMVPLLPFLVLGVLPFLQVGGLWRLRLCQALVGVSIVTMLMCTAVLLHMPEGEVLLSNPLYEIILPAALRHEFALNTQDVRELGPRADASFALGALLGFPPLASYALLAAVWAAAYAPSIGRTLSRFRRTSLLVEKRPVRSAIVPIPPA